MTEKHQKVLFATISQKTTVYIPNSQFSKPTRNVQLSFRVYLHFWYEEYYATGHKVIFSVQIVRLSTEEYWVIGIVYYRVNMYTLYTTFE